MPQRTTPRHNQPKKGLELILFILFLILAVIGIAVIGKGRVQDGRDTFNIRPIGAIILAVALILLAFDSFTIVPTRNLAVQTSFGKPVDTLGNGFHLISPWSSTEEFDATIQTLKLSDDKDDNGEPIRVRLANAATATVDVTVQWQIDPNANITQLYLDFRNFDNIGTNVVRRQLSSALNSTFETYDPLLSLKGGDRADMTTLADLAKDATNKLASALPPGVLVRSLLIPKITFDESIQAKINQYLAALAETQIAEQRQKTAEAQKKANDLLAMANSTPAVLYQNCLDMVERLTRDGKVLPAAFTCGLPPGTSVLVK
jgi:regulator of protease activity HflC (stomatin/prohibitin superfamily)